MQLLNLIKPLEEMTNEELQEHLRGTRHNRNFNKPAAKAHVKRAGKKTSRAKVTKTENMVDGMSHADKLKLIALLQQGELL